jgi:hypothetical protein
MGLIFVILPAVFFQPRLGVPARLHDSKTEELENRLLPRISP